MNDLNSLNQNPYFVAGFGLSFIGALYAIAKKGLSSSLKIIQKRYLITLEVTNRDPSYGWILKWLNKQSSTGISSMKQHIEVETTNKIKPNGEITTKFHFIPSPGSHVVLFKGRWLLVQRNRDMKMMDLNVGTAWENLKLTTFGRNPSFFLKLLKEAQQNSLEETEGMTCIYTSWGTEWKLFGSPRKKKPFESVILDGNSKERILEDIKQFISSSKWYRERGIPYRRGYLFHGTPGSGKSSFVMALAGEINYNICMINLNERGLTDDRLILSFNTVPSQSIILLEDIDAAFTSRKQQDNYGTNVTFSGLLNTLDGVVAAEERIVFMTTNHIEKLDEALIRPGRVDVIEKFGPATQEQIEKMFAKFYPQKKNLANEFFQNVKRQISMAALQGYFLFYKNDPLGAINNFNQLLK